MFINRNIKIIRKLSGLTQDRFAKSLGIKLASLKNYENTDVCPKLEVVLRICCFAGVTPEALKSTDLNPSRINLRPNEPALDKIKAGNGDENAEDYTVEGSSSSSGKLITLLKSNDEFFKGQYMAFNVQVLANLSLLVNQSKKLESLAKMNLACVQKIERQTGKKAVRMVTSRGQKA